MKAAVIHEFGEIPSYEEFADPASSDDLRVQVKAAALENFDKLTASGEHYASRHLFPQFPAVVGHSGVGELSDGTLVAFGGPRPPYGTMAELAVVPREYEQFLTRVPQGVDVAVAASLPASALTSLLPLKYAAKLQPGETVLIHGATGVSGKLAAQIAQRLGAGRIVGTGRNAESLRALKALGVDATIDLTAADEEVASQLAVEVAQGCDVVLDFLWGHPAELIFGALVPTEAGFARRRVRYVQIGQAAGPTITLSAEALRTSGLELTGAGNIPPEVVPEAVSQVWDWIRDRVLTIDVQSVPLSDVAQAWQRDGEGARIVLVP
jgi:NADPH:quinone reductase-like Zn-dependent oxidoreductase